jgi:NAD(P)-dependent dehydrogenase (short-subunit alcohol dehydrogenase family)
MISGVPVGLVTGASSGIGRATAEALAAAGYRVAVGYRTNGQAGEAVAASIGGRAYGMDVADAEAMVRLVGQVEAELGPLSIAVSNAGTYEEVPIEDVTVEQWNRTLRVHLGGAFHMARAVVPGMRRRGHGSIVLVASELALAGADCASAYVSAKAALIGLGRSLARELAPEIRANIVAPGPVDTPLLPDGERSPDHLAAIPLRRLGRPEEIAAAIVHLAQAPWTTGAVYSINGGVVIQ